MHWNFSNRRAIRSVGLAGLAASTALLAACASVPPPKEQLAVTETEFRNAQSTGAATTASVELERARAKISEARAAIKDEDNARARRLLEEAEVDARRAAAKANADRADKALAELRESIRALEQEAARPPAAR